MFHGSLSMFATYLFRPEPEAPTSAAAPEQSAEDFFVRFIFWLMEPINFPGKWPNGAVQPERYNKAEGDGVTYFLGPIER